MSASKEVQAYVGTVRQITKHRFGVDSQSDPAKSYTIQRVPKSHIWYCDCKHFHYNITRRDEGKRYCYHILACIEYREVEFTARNIERIKVKYKCPECKTTKFNKNGVSHLRSGMSRQKYRCPCGRGFVLLPAGFNGSRNSPEVIMDAMYLIMMGVSSRNVARQIKHTHKVKISHPAVLGWTKKYIRLIKEYTDTLLPDTSDVWSIDEAVVNVKKTEKLSKGFHVWLWSIIDPKTRFLIASSVSKRRETRDARKIIGKGKETGCSIPNYVISDSLKSYGPAIRKEFMDRIAHIKTKAIRDGFTNRPIERYHNEIRENLKTRRGLGNDESAQDFAEMLRINHNFIRPHMGLDGATPAEAAGIDEDLGEDKIAGLLERRDEMEIPDYLKDLGDRTMFVHMLNIGTAIKIVPKTWMRKNMWHEIDDVLKQHDFAWTSFGKNEGCWVRAQ